MSRADTASNTKYPRNMALTVSASACKDLTIFTALFIGLPECFWVNQIKKGMESMKFLLINLWHGTYSLHTYINTLAARLATKKKSRENPA
jgi:hypothetical protein